MSEEHPFAGYIRTLGRGRHGSRSLTREEAYDAMRAILMGEVADVQLGAFLMLMRVKEEEPEEVAGMIQALRERLVAGLPAADLDWPSYAGKRRHLPWYLLSVLLLARNGVRVFMHGSSGHTAGRIYTDQALAALGYEPARDAGEADAQLGRQGFTYMPLEAVAPELEALIGLRGLLGLRSPAHTLARMLNPGRAAASLQGIFHPGYLQIHQGGALALNEPAVTVLKGEGGESERPVDRACRAVTARAGVGADEPWKARLSSRVSRPEQLELAHLVRVWTGDAEDRYGEAAVIGTAAMAIRLMDMAPDQAGAERLAEAWWQARDRRLPATASWHPRQEVLS